VTATHVIVIMEKTHTGTPATTGHNFGGDTAPCFQFMVQLC